jgi:hypothetical protein
MEQAAESESVERLLAAMPMPAIEDKLLKPLSPEVPLRRSQLSGGCKHPKVTAWSRLVIRPGTKTPQRPRFLSACPAKAMIALMSGGHDRCENRK